MDLAFIFTNHLDEMEIIYTEEILKTLSFMVKVSMYQKITTTKVNLKIKSSMEKENILEKDIIIKVNLKMINLTVKV